MLPGSGSEKKDKNWELASLSINSEIGKKWRIGKSFPYQLHFRFPVGLSPFLLGGYGVHSELNVSSNFPIIFHDSAHRPATAGKRLMERSATRRKWTRGGWDKCRKETLQRKHNLEMGNRCKRLCSAKVLYGTRWCRLCEEMYLAISGVMQTIFRSLLISSRYELDISSVRKLFKVVRPICLHSCS